MKIGYRLILDFERPAAELIKAFAELPAANISDNLGRLATPVAQIHAIGTRATTICGPCFTVKTRPGDNLLIHKALSVARPGDVIVVDGQGDHTTAYLGEIMASTALQRGLAGYVVDGLIRDPDGIEKLGLPVFARGATPRGPHKDGPGELNVPVTIGGTVVNPGDIVVGDASGLVFVPREHAQEIYEKSLATLHSEEKKLKDISEGKLDTSWIDKRLREQGFEI